MENRNQNPDGHNPEQEEGLESQNQYLDPDRDDLTYGIDPDKRPEQKPFDHNNIDQINHPLPEEDDEHEDDNNSC